METKKAPARAGEEPALRRASASAVLLALLVAGCQDARGSDADGNAPIGSAVPAPWVFVDDFGARPDDGLDDRAAIQDALGAVEAGGRVMFGPGRYTLAGPLLVQRDRVLLQGAGAASVIVASAPMPVLLHFGAGGHKLQDCGATALALDGADLVEQALLLVENTRDSSFTDLRLGGALGWGLIETTATGEGSTHSPRNVYRGLSLSENRDGGGLWLGSKNTIVSEVNAHGNGGDGLVFRALPFGNGNGALETTQCLVGDCKSSDNDGYGFVFDGTAKLTASNLNSNHNALGGFLLANSAWEPGMSASAGVVSGSLSGLCSRNDGLGRPLDAARVLETADGAWVSDLSVTGLVGIQPMEELDTLGVRVAGWRNAILSGTVLRNTRLSVGSGQLPDGSIEPSRAVVVQGLVVSGVPSPGVRFEGAQCLLDNYIVAPEATPIEVRGDVKLGLGHP